MSGPATAVYLLAPMGAIILAAQALREARAAGGEYFSAVDEARTRQETLRDAMRAREAVRRSHGQKVVLQAHRLQARQDALLQTIEILGQQSPQLVASASGLDPLDLTASIADLENEMAQRVEQLDRLDAELRLTGDRLALDWQDGLAGAQAMPGIESALAQWIWQRRLIRSLSRDDEADLSASVTRILERLDVSPDALPPADVTRCARAVMLAATREHGEALLSDLRSKVQRANEVAALFSKESAEAQQLLGELAGMPGDPLFLDAARALEAVLLGRGRLADALPAVEVWRAAHQQREREAAAEVLEQSLRDLGYEVDGISSTLFIEGGVAHFQRPDWGAYHVRLRLDAATAAINFNVVRARGAEENAERKKLDALAEDRWCSGFPKLMETLAARGLSLNVTRLLGAGELPVQVVDPAQLPAASREKNEDESSARPALARTLNAKE